MGWPITRYEFDTPEWVDGKMIPRTYVMENLDFQAAISPSIFRTSSGEYFRRLNWHEIPGSGLKREHAVYVGLTQDEGRELLRFHGYDLPDDLVEPSPANQSAFEEALEATLDLLRAHRADKSADLVELVARSPGRTLDIDDAIRTLCRLRCEDQRAMAAGRITVNATARRAIDLLDGFTAPLRLERDGRLLRLGKP
jgi:hypothetical protein